MGKADLVHGCPRMVDHTPVAAVAAGDVVVVNDVPFIAHVDIAANRLGALATGGAVYDIVKATGVATAIANGKKVFWDAAAQQATEVAAGNTHLGHTIAASTDNDAKVRVRHDPGA